MELLSLLPRYRYLRIILYDNIGTISTDVIIIINTEKKNEIIRGNLYIIYSIIYL